MPRKGDPVIIADGIYKYDNGYRVTSKVHGKQLEQWYAPDSDEDQLKLIRATWIIDRKKGEKKTSAKSFQKAVTDYLKTFPKGTRRRDNAERDLGAWLPRFKTHETHKITSQAIREQLALWQPDYAASTLNHRRQELKNLFTFLNGKAGANPVRDVPKVKERYDDARGQAPDVIEAVLAQMRPSLSRIRLRVWWETAIPPSQQARLTRSGFKAHEKTQAVQPRRKGAGVPGKVLPLSARAVDALTDFYAAKLEGIAPSTSTIYRAFRLAVGKAKAQWPGRWPAPENLSPKDLRHSRLTEAYKHSKDLNAVAELGMHADLSTTQRYVRAVASHTARAAITLMESASQNVPSGTAGTSKNGRKFTRGRARPHRGKTR